MLTQCAHKGVVVTTQRVLRKLVPVGLLLGVATVSHVYAQEDELPPVSLGAGLQTSFIHQQPATGDSTDNFRLNSLRFYVNGKATNNISFMINTDINYGGSLFVCPEEGSCGGGYGNQGNQIQVLDAVAQIGVSDKLNIWFGRFLPPSDRANMYGPYYSHHWAVFTDGVQDGYPFIFQGRQNGAMYWGQFDKVKLSAGAFDGSSTNGNSSLIGAGRVQVDFWDPEAGYYLNGTYYGQRNLLAIGLAGQVQSADPLKSVVDELTAKTATSFDFLLERMTGRGSAVSAEVEVVRYNGLGGYPTAPGAQFETLHGGYVLGAYLLPKTDGPGQFEALVKYGIAVYSQDKSNIYPDFRQKTTEVNFNYILNEFNARMMIFFKNTNYTAVRMNDVQVGVGLQIQM